MNWSIFNAFVRIGYEPLCVVAGFGLLFFCWYAWKEKKKEWIFFILAALLFLLAWRLCMLKANYSKRYNLSFIIPVIFFAAFICKPLKPVSLLLVVLISVICGLQTFHINWNERALLVEFRRIGEDAARYPEATVLTNQPSFKHLEYYSGRKIFFENFPEAGDGAFCRWIARNIEISRGLGQPFYFVFTQERSNPPLDPVLLGADKEEWTVIGREFTNRKKRDVSVVCRFMPGKHAVSGMGEPSVFPYGDFEKTHENRPAANKDLVENGHPWFSGAFLFPDGWFVHNGHCRPFSAFEAEAVPSATLGGAFALRLKSSAPCAVYSIRPVRVTRPSVLRFSIRPLRRSMVSIKASAYPDGPDPKFRLVPLIDFIAAPGEKRELSFTLRPEDFDDGRENIRLYLQLHSGEILFDDFRLCGMP